MKLTMYHNPACSKSRKTLELIEKKGISVNIIEYLKTPPDPATVQEIARMLGVSVADLLRTGEADYASLTEIASPNDDEALAKGLSTYPKALQRPIIVDEESGRATIGRPPENVLGLIDPD